MAAKPLKRRNDTDPWKIDGPLEDFDRIRLIRSGDRDRYSYPTPLEFDSRVVGKAGAAGAPEVEHAAIGKQPEPAPAERLIGREKGRQGSAS